MRSGGFTLLEIMLVLGLTVILALVAVPSMEGWWSEHKLRAKANELIMAVQSAKIQAERTGQAQVVLLGETAFDEGPKHSIATEADEYEWTLVPLRGDRKESATEIFIDAHGRVEPMTFRVAQGKNYMEFQFDFLTGHARELGFSF